MSSLTITRTGTGSRFKVESKPEVGLKRSVGGRIFPASYLTGSRQQPTKVEDSPLPTGDWEPFAS